MKPFLVEAIQALSDRAYRWEELIVVLPSKRAKVFFTNHLLKATPTTQIAPVIYSIESFVAELAQTRLAPQFHQLTQFFLAYKKHMPEESCDDFDAFLKWAPRIIKDLNDVDAYALDADEVLPYLGAYYALEQQEEEDFQTAFTPLFWEQLPVIFRSFVAQMQSQNWATLGMLYREALASLEVYLAQTEKHHFFVGFNALNAAEEIILQEFLVNKKGEAYWDLDQALYADKAHAAGRFIRNYQNQWPYYRQQPYLFDAKNFSQPKNIKAIGLSGNVHQAAEVSRILAEEKMDFTSTAVVLGDEQLLLPILGALPEDLNAWNVTMGYPVAQLPVLRFFHHYIALLLTAEDGNYNKETAVSLLTYAPIKKMLPEAERGAFEEKLNQLKTSFATHVTAEDLLFSPLASLTQLNTEAVEDTQPFLTHLIALSDRFARLLTDEISKAAVKEYKQLLLQLQHLIENSPIDMNLSALNALITEGVGQLNLDFKGDPVEGIQIMGMLETRVLDFETVIITHVNEGVLPVGKNDQSFFPFSVKKKFGLPTFLDNDAIYTYHFYRLLQRAKNIYLLYNNKSEGLGGGEKSRFIHQLAFNTLSNHNFEAIQRQENPPPLSNLPTEIVKTEPMLMQLNALGKRGFSPTSLCAYLKDPIEFYERYLLGVNPVDPPSNTMSHFRRGEIVHDTLDELYTPFYNTEMQPAFYDTMLKKLPKTMAKQYQKHYPLESKDRGENALLYSAYERAVRQFLTTEKAQIEKGNTLIIRALEESFSLPFPIPSSKDILLRGKIDRIDEYNGKLRVIDYKTGPVNTQNLAWSSPDVFFGDYARQPLFQLLLYGLVLFEQGKVMPPFEAGIISLKTPRLGLQKVTQKNSESKENKMLVDSQLIADFTFFLTSLLEEIFDKKKSFVSLKESDS